MYHIIEIQSYNHKDEATGQWSVKPSTIVTPIPQFEDRDKAVSQSEA